MVPSTMDSSQITLYVEKASTLGMTKKNTKGNGIITKCMVKVFYHGLVVVNTKVAFKMTRDKVMVYLPFPMVANTMANGSKVNSMARDSIVIEKIM